MSNYLHQVYERLIRELDINTYRFLYDKIDFNHRLIGIVGPRGVGKTTLLLQTIKNHLYQSGKVFYFSADHTYFNEVSILSFVDTLYNNGINQIFIDEIHKYANWNQELKNIYDSYPKLKVVFSGSSSIDLVQGSYDLSRRATLIHMPGLSFREYLNIKTNTQFAALPLETLLKEHTELALEISQTPNLMAHFEAYKKSGYYPFNLNDDDTLYLAIANIIDKTINEDIADFYKLKTNSLKTFRRIINFLATIPPGKVNTNKIAQNLSIDFKTVEHYIEILNKTGLVKSLYPAAHGNQVLTKASKIYLDNTTLLSGVNTFLSAELDIGTLRELAFLQFAKGANLPIFHAEKGDFKIHDVSFEIGGKSKTMGQLSQIKGERYCVKDNMIVGYENHIPLYLFGFLY